MRTVRSETLEALGGSTGTMSRGKEGEDGYPDLMSREFPGLMSRKGVPYHVTYPMMHLMLPTLLPL